MESLNQETIQEIMVFLQDKKEPGASASEIARGTSKNRMTISKYLEIMTVQGKLASQTLAQAKYYQVSDEFNKPHIMIVDDDDNILNLVKLSLMSGRYHLTEARNGVEALEAIREQVPDLVLLDLMMPKLDGKEVCRILRSNPKTSDIPIIMLTAKSQTIDKVEGLNLGATDFITKPFDPMELEARVNATLRRFTELKNLNPVTELKGHAALLKELKTTKARVVFLDIHNFKEYNFRQGFKLGNELLKLLARILQSTLDEHGSSQDLVYHLNGDDFVMLLYSNVDAIVKHILKNVSEFIPVLTESSYGIAVHEVDSLDVQDEIKEESLIAMLKKAKRLQ